MTDVMIPRIPSGIAVGSGAPASSLIVPQVVGAMGAAQAINVGNVTTKRYIGTLSQAGDCPITLSGFMVGDYSELLLSVSAAAGQTFSITNPITYDDGNLFVQRVGTTNLTIYSDDGVNLKGAHNQRPRTFFYGPSGAAVVGTDTHRYYFDTPARIISVRASAGTAPGGQTFIGDVRKNGVSMYTTVGNRPTIAIAANTSGLAVLPDVTAFAAGDFLEIAFMQVGNAPAAASASVQVTVLEAW